MLLNTAFGVANVRKELLNVTKTLEVSPLRKAFLVILPAAAPTILTGMRISMGIAWLVIVAAEMLVGGTGIGYFVWNEWNNLSIVNVIISILVIGLVGMLLDQALARLGFAEEGDRERRWGGLRQSALDADLESRDDDKKKLQKQIKELESILNSDKRKLEVIKVNEDLRNKLIATAGRPVWDAWVAEMDKKGLPGKEALDKVLDFAKKAAAWTEATLTKFQPAEAAADTANIVHVDFKSPHADEPDEPEFILDGLIREHKEFLQGFKGNKDVNKKIFEEAMTPSVEKYIA